LGEFVRAYLTQFQVTHSVVFVKERYPKLGRPGFKICFESATACDRSAVGRFVFGRVPSILNYQSSTLSSIGRRQ
jgi:hypothetical protein